jgi:hypothetical protein
MSIIGVIAHADYQKYGKWLFAQQLAVYMSKANFSSLACTAGSLVFYQIR